MKIRKILVPVDFSKFSARAADYAVGLSQRLGDPRADIDLLHVLELPHYVVPDVVVDVPGEKKQTLTQFAQGAAKKQLDALVGQLEAAGATGVRGRMTAGYPRNAILEIADEGGYDLIVMATRGRTGLSHLLLGSVAEQVLRRAKIPVLTIRGTDEARRER